MSWTDERVELLKKLWQDGLSASQIAAELGGVTRNAVIGKVHRLGLSGRGQPTSSIKRQRRTHSPGIRRVAADDHRRQSRAEGRRSLPEAELSRGATWWCRSRKRLSIFR